MLPEQPQTFREPTAPERPWSWRHLDADGAEVDLDEALARQRFVSQADAESWIGEVWEELRDQGVDGVTLLEVDRVVYGPMSLHA
ncbi:MAG: hypothetical protein V9G04_09140 [Nocardioides sp.]|jgi:hypothetical protein